MRPVTRPDWTAAWAGFPLIDTLYEQLGRFCATCERPLTAGAFLWQPSTGTLLSGRARPGAWPDVLTLCGECAAAAHQKPADATILLPDRHLTFRLDDSSPFRYERRTITAGTDQADVVIVVGTTDVARATIRHFGLNTRYFDEATNQLATPDPDADVNDATMLGDHAILPSIDPRLRLRTRAWEHATAYLPLLADEDIVDRTASERQLRISLENSGFWSVWATVLWAAFHDVDRLTRLLMPPARPLTTRTVVAVAGAPTGAASDFPNTRADWLPDRPAAVEPG